MTSGIDISPGQSVDLETGREHRLVIRYEPFKVVVYRNADAADLRDDKLVLTGTTHRGAGYHWEVRLADEQWVTVLSPGVLEATFQHVPNGRYSCFLDMGVDAHGQTEGGYYLFEDERVPLERGDADDGSHEDAFDVDVPDDDELFDDPAELWSPFDDLSVAVPTGEPA